MRVAVIGVGDMGAEMIPHLVETDFEIVAYDKLPERLQLAKDAGAKVAGSVAEAATGADVVIQLTMSDDIPDVLIGEQGALTVVKPGAIVVVTSTTTPQMLNRVIEAAPAGVEVVDAPIVGGVRYAREKSVTFLLGGSEQVASKLDPVLSVMGIIRYVGKSGNGVAYKLITNVAIMAAEAGLREALDLADELDMDYELSLDLMSVGPMAAVVSRTRHQQPASAASLRRGRRHPALGGQRSRACPADLRGRAGTPVGGRACQGGLRSRLRRPDAQDDGPQQLIDHQNR